MATRNPSSVRNVRYRTLGSGTTLTDEMPVPMGLYHGGRLARWCWRHRVGTGGGLLFLFLYSATGSFVGGLLFFLLLLAVGLTMWVAWKRRGAEGAAFSAKDAVLTARQRAALVKQWPLACESTGVTGTRTRDAPRLTRMQSTLDGTITATVASGRIGIPVSNIERAAADLADVIGCREVVVTQTGPGVARVAFHFRDPVGRQLPLMAVPLASKGTLAYGIRTDGAVATVNATQSLLIGGLTRKGKSNTVWGLLADCIRQGIHVDLYVSDPKGGVELDAFEGRVGSDDGSLIRVRQYATNPKDTVTMIDAVEKAMHARQYWMKVNGVRKIEPSAENPLVVVILDETLPLTDLLKKGTDSALGRIAYTGAATAYVVWANTQVAQIDAIGRFRDLVPQRICFATPNPQVTDSVLGQGSASSGASCAEIRTPGVGFSHSEGDPTARKFRAAFVDDPTTRLIARGMLPQDVMEAAEVAKGQQKGKVALYRWYYADHPEPAQVQYIGISYDVLKREAQHNAALRDFMAGDVRRTVVWYDTRKEALAAEKHAIETERPIFNVIHNGRNANRRRDRVKVPA